MSTTTVRLERCPLCGDARRRHRVSLGHRTIVTCLGCRHVFAAVYDAEALLREYRDAYYESAEDPRIQSWAERHRPVWDALARQVLERADPVHAVLDVGAGTGGFLESMRRLAPAAALFAVEPSPHARASLRRRLDDVAFPVDDAHALGRQEERFDVVTLLQTLEHLRDPVAAATGAWHSLREGGLLLVTVPNRGALAARLRGRRADCWANNTHLQFFDRAHVVQVLRKAGFRRIRRLHAFGGGQCSGPAAASLQWLLRRTGLSTELRVAAWR